MKMHQFFSREILHISLLVLALAAHQYVYAAGEQENTDNLRFSGQLVAQPCIIAPGNESVGIDLNSFIGKSFYLQARSGSQSFSVILSECDLSVGKTVRVSFKGNESLALPGLLALDAGSKASGIAIGLETANGTPLPLGKETAEYPLKQGENRIDFKAYVQGEPDAITNKSITPGPFTATVTFYLNYE